MNGFRRFLPRLLVLAAAAFALPGGSSCDGNLGSVSTGAVSFRVSVAPNFAPADGASGHPSASFDGSFVAFASRATNIGRSAPGFQEIFVRDRLGQSVKNASKLSDLVDKSGLSDCDHPAISADGELVVFDTRSDLLNKLVGVQAGRNIFAWSRSNDMVFQAVNTIPGTPPNDYLWPDGDTANPSISAAGQYLAFESVATNLELTQSVVYPPTSTRHIYVRNFGNPTRLVTHAFGAPATPANGSSEQPVLSADGQWIVFRSRATNLIAGGTNNFWKVYRAAVDGSSMELISRMDGLAGAEADDHCSTPVVSADGSRIAFAFQGGNLEPVSPAAPDFAYPLILRDLTDPLNPVTRTLATDIMLVGIFNPILVGDRAKMSDDGRLISYTSVRGDGVEVQVCVLEVDSGASRIVSRGVVSQIVGLSSIFTQATMSGDGRWAFWRSDYTQEVFSDTNDLGDVFGYGPLR